MPNVTLIDFTGKGREDEQWHAAHMLVFTKNTRLEMDPNGLERVKAMEPDQLREQLTYMANTIPSSWEFVDLTFLLSGVTRACAQQITRTRTASYAMQSQRVTDVRSAPVTNPLDKCTLGHHLFNNAAEEALLNYAQLIDEGVAAQDARGVLPMNIQCNLVAKYNLRSLVDLVLARKSLRAQGEYSDIVTQMEQAVLDVWPWAAPFFVPKQARAIEVLERVAQEIGITTGSGPGWDIAKAIDMLRKG